MELNHSPFGIRFSTHSKIQKAKQSLIFSGELFHNSANLVRSEAISFSGFVMLSKILTNFCMIFVHKWEHFNVAVILKSVVAGRETVQTGGSLMLERSMPGTRVSEHLSVDRSSVRIFWLSAVWTPINFIYNRKLWLSIGVSDLKRGKISKSAPAPPRAAQRPKTTMIFVVPYASK